MKSLNLVRFHFFILLLPTFIIGCQNTEDIEDEKVTVEIDSEAQEIEEDVNESDDYEFLPPSTLQVASIFKKAGLIYDKKLPNSVDKVDSYTSIFEQSLAFGVYSSDLAYSVMHEKYEAASNLLNSLRILGNKIGLETVFNSEDLIVRFENNIGNQDSIIDILIFVQENTDDYIEENGKVDLSVIYYTGAWVEGMYLGANTVMNDQDKKVGVLISEQMTIAEILLKGLEHIEDQSIDVTDLTDAVQELVDIYYNLESVKSLGEESDYIDIVLTSEETSTMSGKIVELREAIVK